MKTRFPDFLSKAFSSSSNTPPDRNAEAHHQAKMNPRKADVFGYAALQKLGEKPQPLIWGRWRLSKVSKAVQESLTPTGEEREIASQQATPVRGHKTGLKNIFKNSSSDTFSVRVDRDRLVKRTRAEIETHILLQSHLAANYPDAAIHSREVIALEDIDTPGCCPSFSNPFAGFLARRSANKEAALLDSSVASTSSTPRSLGEPEAQSSNRQFTPSEQNIEPKQTSPSTRRSRRPRLPAEQNSVDSPTSRPAEFGRLRPVTQVTSPSASILSGANQNRRALGQRTQAQKDTLEFVKQNLNSTPLDFMNAMAKRDPELAGYFAYQLRRMQTPAGPVPEGASFSRSAYPGLLVRGPGHSEMVNGANVRYEDPEKHADWMASGSEGSVQMRVLLRDLKKSIDRQNRQLVNDPSLGDGNASEVLPLGIAAAIHTSGSPRAENSNSKANGARSQSVIAALEHMPDAAGPAEDKWLKDLTANHPAATAFLSFVREGLLFQDINPEKRCQRFNYVKECDFGHLMDQTLENMGDDGRSWGATFLEGIERDPEMSGNQKGSWRIRTGETWIYGSSEQEIMRHVMFQAMEHLDAKTPPPPSIPIFPLAAYELLGKAVGKPVPQFLKEREQQVVAMVTANHKATSAKRTQQDEAYCQQQVDKAEAAESNQRSYRAIGARNATQMGMCDSGLSPEKITADSVESNFTFNPTTHSQLDTVRNFQARLSQTHVRQAIHYKAPGSQRNDNLCWLRSSWLSVMSAATPEHLGLRMREMYNDDVNLANARIHPSSIEHLAGIYRADPVGFLQGGREDMSWQQGVKQSARLGEGKSMVPNPTPDSVRGSRSKPVEAVLKSVHQNIAAGFRYENERILDEAESTRFPGAFASSDMVIALHRAFNVPALIVEVGKPIQHADGTRDLTSSHIRVAAVKGSALAGQIALMEQGATSLGDDQNAMQALLGRFAEHPVIWFEHDHYEVYLPKTLVNHQASR